MKKMKKYIVALAIIVTCATIGFGNAHAEQVSFGIHNMKYLEWYYYPSATNDYIYKSTEGLQKLKIERASTALTDPCENCSFAARLINQGGDVGEMVSSLKMGQTGTFNLSYYPGSYKIQIERIDFTALKTMISALWTY